MSEVKCRKILYCIFLKNHINAQARKQIIKAKDTEEQDLKKGKKKKRRKKPTQNQQKEKNNKKAQGNTCYIL